MILIINPKREDAIKFIDEMKDVIRMTVISDGATEVGTLVEQRDGKRTLVLYQEKYRRI